MIFATIVQYIYIVGFSSSCSCCCWSLFVIFGLGKWIWMNLGHLDLENVQGNKLFFDSEAYSCFSWERRWSWNRQCLGVVGMRPSKKWMLTSSHWNDPTTLGISPIENPRKPTQTGAQWTRNGKMVFYPIPYVTIGPTHFPEVWLVHTSLNW